MPALSSYHYNCADEKSTEDERCDESSGHDGTVVSGEGGGGGGGEGGGKACGREEALQLQ